MPRFREALPQSWAERPARLLTDSGLETSLVFHKGIDLPAFAAFPLLACETGHALLRAYYEEHLQIAAEHDVGFLLEAPTWRASHDWGVELGFSDADLDRLNRDAIAFLCDLRTAFADRVRPIVVSGNLGPRGDAYRPEAMMSSAEARRYHEAQIRTFADTEADMISAFTLTYVDEAIGIVQAGEAAGLPTVIAFTVETDGRLPDGTSLGDAISRTDAETDGAAAYFMVNCAHPDHFADRLSGDWTARIKGLRPNASRCSHAELDAAETLDDGDAEELGRLSSALTSILPLTVLGGCCGTDARHIGAVAQAWTGGAPIEGA